MASCGRDRFFTVNISFCPAESETWNSDTVLVYFQAKKIIKKE